MEQNKTPSSLPVEKKNPKKKGLIIFHDRMRGNTLYSVGFRSTRKSDEGPQEGIQLHNEH